MNFLSRVVWSEGMYLGPQHFQIQSRYFEDSIRFALDALWFEPYGVAGAALDADALLNGTISVLHARGVFPDGLPFHMSESDPVPPSRNIAGLFPPGADSVTVSLAIPARQPNGLNCIPIEDAGNGAHPDGAIRFLAEASVQHDETSGMDERPVRLGRKNISLLLDFEEQEGMVSLPIGRVQRDGSGHFIYDPAFIPPCVQISASDRIMSILQRLLEILEEKSTTLSRGKQAGGKSWSEFATRDIANFWFLHTVNSALAPLRHFYFAKRGHPEQLYRQLLQLGGALCTFALDSHPRELPQYDHWRLDRCFNDLDLHIRTHLETIVPTNCISIPLEPGGDYFYEGQIADQRCMGPSRWVLAVASGASEVDIIAKTPQLVKVCSKLFVPELVKRALPGMGLTHLPVPPAAIAARLDTHYFGINKAGPCWDHILQTRQVGVYVPGELPKPQLELLVILQS